MELLTDKPIRDAFYLNYYHWAQRDFRWQVENNFSLLRALRGRMVQRFMAYITSLNKEQQLELGSAIVKRFHPTAMSLQGEQLTIKEQGLCDVVTRIVTTALPDEPDDVPGKINKKTFSGMIKDSLRPVCGDVSEKLGPHDWKYETVCGNWVIHTFVDVGGRYRQLAYHHSIGTVDGKQLTSVISILSWLGIASQTVWDLMTVQDMEEAAQSLAKVCSHFIESASEFLNEISMHP